MSTFHRGGHALTWLFGALGEPTRRRIYETVREARGPMSRAGVADSLGIGLRLAAFHLDKLVHEGLLSAYYARPEGSRGGPGAGRPPKWYVAGSNGFDITVPPRRHDLAALILLRAVIGAEKSADTRLLEEARRCGRELAGETPGRELEPVLDELGYEPRPAAGRCIDLLNCPFHELVEEAQETVCAMNLALLKGVTDAIPSPQVAVLQPREGYCCVKLVPEPAPNPARP